VASVAEKRLRDGSRAYLVRYRTSDGQQRSRQFKRKRDAEAYVSIVEVDRLHGALIDPRLGRITVAERRPRSSCRASSESTREPVASS